MNVNCYYLWFFLVRGAGIAFRGRFTDIVQQTGAMHVLVGRIRSFNNIFCTISRRLTSDDGASQFL